MRCPYCAGENTQVKDSRPTEENAAIRRRRVCPDCGGRFTTFERAQLDAGRQAVGAQGALRSRKAGALGRGGRKRPIDDERVERMVSGLARQSKAPARARRPLRPSAALSWRRCAGWTRSPTCASLPSLRFPRRGVGLSLDEVLGEIAAEPGAVHATTQIALRKLRGGDGAAQEALTGGRAPRSAPIGQPR